MARPPSRRPRLRRVGRSLVWRRRLRGRPLPALPEELPLMVGLLAPPKAEPTRLRPPGALAEAVFLERCTGCADCVMACPYGAILYLEDGLPFINPDRTPCLLCRDVPCSKVCEPGALMPVTHPHEIRLGLPHFDTSRCLPHQGQLCQACLDACPLKHVALRLAGPERTPLVSASLCTGCGICQHVCPARAVTIS